MSNENQEQREAPTETEGQVEGQVEQITKNPPPVKSKPKKEKDPKKVAAGKKLAEYNRQAKEALSREIKRENEEEVEGRAEGSWFPELSFTAVLSLVGIAITAIDLFSCFYKKDSDNFELTPKSIKAQTSGPGSVQEIENVSTPCTQKPSPKSKIGMD